MATPSDAGIGDGVVYTIYAMRMVNGQPPLQILPAVESVGGMSVPAG